MTTRQLHHRLGHDHVVAKGTASYKYILARPCDDLKHILNYDREIVVLFSPYITFEARSLDCYKDIESSLSEIRLERATRFLFSRDSQITQKIERFLNAEPEFPAVCAFTYNDTKLFSTQENLSQNLRRNFYARDLFNFHSPLKTEHFFFGRNELIQSIIDRHISGESTGVFGLRRTGKTSLIHALARVARAAKQPLLHIDCQTTDIHLKRWHKLIELIILKICDEHSLKRLDFSNITPDNAAALLRRVLIDLNKKTRANLLITFDEVENISPLTSPTEHWREDSDALLFWQTIREICQNSAGLLNCVIVGINPILIENVKLCGYDNPLFKFMNINYIKGFSVDHTHEMCTTLGRIMGLEFDMRSTNFLNDHFGGNPYLIRQACSYIHQNIAFVNRPAKVTLSIAEDSASKIEGDASTYATGMLEVLNDFYPNEFELLCWLAAGKTDEFYGYINNDSSSIGHLCGYGVLEQDAGKYHFRVKIFASSIKQYLDKRSDLFSQDSKREYISKHRSLLEQLLRQQLRSIALTKFGRVAAKEQLLAMLTQARRSHLTSSSISDLFSTGESKLYLTDFFGIVETLEEEFENLTGLSSSEIKTALSVVNQTRFDAHSNNIPDRSFAEFRQAASKLIKSFEL